MLDNILEKNASPASENGSADVGLSSSQYANENGGQIARVYGGMSLMMTSMTTTRG